MSLLASQWMIFPSPQSDRRRMTSVVDVHEVEVNAQIHLLVPHKLGFTAFFCAIYSLYLYAQTPLSLSTSAYMLIIHVLITTLRHFMIIMLCICFLIFILRNLLWCKGLNTVTIYSASMVDREATD